jgi:hypothetical protein
VLGNLRVDEFFAVPLELAERPFVINAHQPAIAGNVGS